MSDLANQEILDFIAKGLDNDRYYFTKSEQIARKVMIELIKAGRSEFLLLRDDEVAAWWNKIYSGVQAKFDKHQEKVRLYEVKLTAYNKLTAEQRKALGIRKPVAPKGM